jgi:hypothetical protein
VRPPATPGARTLEREQVLPAAPDQLFEFFADAHNLEAITPPWLNFRVVTAGPIGMAPGTLIEYRLRLHRVPIRWLTRIESWVPGRRFEDRQVRGPYRLWHHTRSRHSDRRAAGARLRRLRLEEFDGVARWILDQDLATARSLDDLTAETRPLGGETLNGRVEIGNDDLEPIPPPGLWDPAGFARATCARLVEKQSQVILRQTGESRGGGKVNMEAEAITVEVDRLFDVCDEVPHGRLRHGSFLRFGWDELPKSRRTPS